VQIKKTISLYYGFMVDIANDADFGRKLRAKRGDYIEKIILKVENSYLLSSSFQPFVQTVIFDAA
jgi:hypothetical protein